MAGAGYKLFNTGDVLTAAQVNTYLQEQVVMVFANAAARTTALSGVLAEGMVTYLKDTDALEIYSGAAWVGYGSGDITGITTGATSGLTGGVTSGTADLKLNTTAKGGLLVGTGSGTVSELAVGSNTQVLTADSTTASGLKWATPSSGTTFAGCRLYKSGAQTIAHATWVALTFDSEDYDTDAFHSTSSNTSRITIPTGKGGYYLVQAQITWAANSSGYRLSYVGKNVGAVNQSYFTQDPVTYTGRFTQFYSFVNNFVAGDYLEIWVNQSSGGNVNVEGGNYSPQATLFHATYLGA